MTGELPEAAGAEEEAEGSDHERKGSGPGRLAKRSRPLHSESDSDSGSDHPQQPRKRGLPWTEEEHRSFLSGLKKLGKGDWRGISRHHVPTRTPTQVASHAQKYYIRQLNLHNRKRRSSLFDMAPEADGAYQTAGASEATSQRESLQQQASSYNGTEAPSGSAAGADESARVGYQQWLAAQLAAAPNPLLFQAMLQSAASSGGAPPPGLGQAAGGIPPAAAAGRLSQAGPQGSMQGFPGMLQLGFGGQQQLQMASMNLLMQQQAAAAAAVMFAAGAASSGYQLNDPAAVAAAMQHHYASTCAANQFAAMQGQFGGVPYPPQMGAPFGMFPGASAGLFRPPSGSNLTGLSDPGLCASQQQQQSLQQQHSLQQQPSLQQPQHTEGTPQGTADSALTCSRDPAQQHSDRRRSSSNPCTPRSTQTPRSTGTHAHERPGSCDQPLHIQGGSTTSLSAGNGEPHSMGRLFRPQASHARLLPGSFSRDNFTAFGHSSLHSSMGSEADLHHFGSLSRRSSHVGQPGPGHSVGSARGDQRQASAASSPRQHDPAASEQPFKPVQKAAPAAAAAAAAKLEASPAQHETAAAPGATSAQVPTEGLSTEAPPPV